MSRFGSNKKPKLENRGFQKGGRNVSRHRVARGEAGARARKASRRVAPRAASALLCERLLGFWRGRNFASVAQRNAVIATLMDGYSARNGDLIHMAGLCGDRTGGTHPATGRTQYFGSWWYDSWKDRCRPADAAELERRYAPIVAACEYEWAWLGRLAPCARALLEPLRFGRVLGTSRWYPERTDIDASLWYIKD
jgi:hypothetical protein